MLCQICQKNAANVHFTQIVNSKKIELYLCEQCAKEKGQLNFGSPFGIADFFAGLMGFGENAPAHGEMQLEQRCKTCGMSYEDFQKTGKLGCGDCYKLFGDKMKPVLKRLHGNLGHTGKMPGRLSGKLPGAKAAAFNEKPAPKEAADAKAAVNTKEAADSLEVEQLKDMLNKCIQNEEYEKAAVLRDKIREIESRRQG